MTTGTKNEVLTFKKLTEESCVKELYKVGLFQHNDHLFLGVFPDGIAIIDGDDHGSQVGCVKIKTRCAPTTIQQA